MRKSSEHSCKDWVSASGGRWRAVHRSGLHDLFVAAWAPVGHEGQGAGGCVVEGDPDAPEVHGDTVGLVLRLPQDGTLIHVRVLGGHRHGGAQGLSSALCSSHSSTKKHPKNIPRRTSSFGEL